ncbi:MAG TPA: c-type cytochrome [Thermoanaerobaculia bacterium]|nr:c-type cytochrome [Thermoanaerobaculia bacterium]
MKKLGKAAPWMVLGLLLTATVASVADDPGKAVFMAQKCNLCHSVTSQSIDRTMKSSKAPDLSNVGATRTADWITKFLKKEEMIDGKKHPKTLTATPEETTQLVKWVSGLKKG